MNTILGLLTTLNKENGGRRFRQLEKQEWAASPLKQKNTEIKDSSSFREGHANSKDTTTVSEAVTVQFRLQEGAREDKQEGERGR